MKKERQLMNDYDKGYSVGEKDRHTQVMTVFDEAEKKFCCSFGDEGCLHGMHKYLRDLIAAILPFPVWNDDYEKGEADGARCWKTVVLRIFDEMEEEIRDWPKEGCGKGIHHGLKKKIVEAYNNRGEDEA
jgi:hypothetical protein